MPLKLHQLLKILPLTLVFLLNSSFYVSTQRISMTIIISSKNNYYYYENKLKMDGSNFKSGWSGHIKSWTLLLEQENGKENVDYILKVQKKDSLNEVSKKLIAFFQSKSHYTNSVLTKTENQMVALTEKINAVN